MFLLHSSLAYLDGRNYTNVISNVSKIELFILGVLLKFLVVYTSASRDCDTEFAYYNWRQSSRHCVCCAAVYKLNLRMALQLPDLLIKNVSPVRKMTALCTAKSSSKSTHDIIEKKEKRWTKSTNVFRHQMPFDSESRSGILHCCQR